MKKKTTHKLIRAILILASIAIPILINTIFTISFWGLGLIVLGMWVISIPIILAGSTIIYSFILPKSKFFTKTLAICAFSLVVGLSLQVYQFYQSTPEKLKTCILNENLMGKIKATDGQLTSDFADHMIFLKLSSTPLLTQKLIQSKEFKQSEDDTTFRYAYAPEWFPKTIQKNETVWGINNMNRLEYIRILVSEDQKTIHAIYLSY